MGSFKQKGGFDEAQYEMEEKDPTAAELNKEEEKEKNEKSEMVGLFAIWKFSDNLDKFLIFLGEVSCLLYTKPHKDKMLSFCLFFAGILMAVGCGATFPVMFVVFGTITNVFAQHDSQDPALQSTDTEFLGEVGTFVWQMAAIGSAMWFSHYVFVACLNYTAERQVQ